MRWASLALYKMAFQAWRENCHLLYMGETLLIIPLSTWGQIHWDDAAFEKWNCDIEKACFLCYDISFFFLLALHCFALLCDETLRDSEWSRAKDLFANIFERWQRREISTRFLSGHHKMLTIFFQFRQLTDPQKLWFGLFSFYYVEISLSIMAHYWCGIAAYRRIETVMSDSHLKNHSSLGPKNYCCSTSHSVCYCMLRLTAWNWDTNCAVVAATRLILTPTKFPPKNTEQLWAELFNVKCRKTNGA